MYKSKVFSQTTCPQSGTDIHFRSPQLKLCKTTSIRPVYGVVCLFTQLGDMHRSG